MEELEQSDPFLARVVKTFAEQHAEKWADPASASGECVCATYEFISFLSEWTPAREEEDHHEKLVEDAQEASWDWYEPAELRAIEKSRNPPPPHDWFDTYNRWGGHAAVFVDGWYIDFTARQFKPDAPYPLVWRREEE